jgi:hypothetical protein
VRPGTQKLAKKTSSVPSKPGREMREKKRVIARQSRLSAEAAGTRERPEKIGCLAAGRPHWRP